MEHQSEDLFDKIHDATTEIKRLLSDSCHSPDLQNETREKLASCISREANDVSNEAALATSKHYKEGKGQGQDYLCFCKLCFLEYRVPVERCERCDRLLISKEIRHQELDDKVQRLLHCKLYKERRKNKWKQWIDTHQSLKVTSRKDSSTIKWDLFEPSDSDEDGYPIVPTEDPKFAALKCDIEERSKKREQLLVVAKDLKSKGNNCFSAGDYTAAILQYEKGIQVCKDCKELYTNKALAELRMQKYAECIRTCTTVLEIAELFENGYWKSKETCIKALHRRALGFVGLCNWTNGLRDTETILSLDSSNAEAKRNNLCITNIMASIHNVEKLLSPNVTGSATTPQPQCIAFSPDTNDAKLDDSHSAESYKSERNTDQEGPDSCCTSAPFVSSDNTQKRRLLVATLRELLLPISRSLKELEPATIKKLTKTLDPLEHDVMCWLFASKLQKCDSNLFQLIGKELAEYAAFINDAKACKDQLQLQSESRNCHIESVVELLRKIVNGSSFLQPLCTPIIRDSIRVLIGNDLRNKAILLLLRDLSKGERKHIVRSILEDSSNAPTLIKLIFQYQHETAELIPPTTNSGRQDTVESRVLPLSFLCNLCLDANIRKEIRKFGFAKIASSIHKDLQYPICCSSAVSVLQLLTNLTLNSELCNEIITHSLPLLIETTDAYKDQTSYFQILILTLGIFVNLTSAQRHNKVYAILGKTRCKSFILLLRRLLVIHNSTIKARALLVLSRLFEVILDEDAVFPSHKNAINRNLPFLEDKTNLSFDATTHEILQTVNEILAASSGASQLVDAAIRMLSTILQHILFLIEASTKYSDLKSGLEFERHQNDVALEYDREAPCPGGTTLHTLVTALSRNLSFYTPQVSREERKLPRADMDAVSRGNISLIVSLLADLQRNTIHHPRKQLPRAGYPTFVASLIGERSVASVTLNPFIIFCIESLRNDTHEPRKNAAIAVAKLAAIDQYRECIEALHGLDTLKQVANHL